MQTQSVFLDDIVSGIKKKILYTVVARLREVYCWGNYHHDEFISSKEGIIVHAYAWVGELFGA